jgi:hypothetical protein
VTILSSVKKYILCIPVATSLRPTVMKAAVDRGGGPSQIIMEIQKLFEVLIA